MDGCRKGLGEEWIGKGRQICSDAQMPITKALSVSPVMMFFTRKGWRARIREAEGR